MRTKHKNLINKNPDFKSDFINSSRKSIKKKIRNEINTLELKESLIFNAPKIETCTQDEVLSDLIENIAINSHKRNGLQLRIFSVFIY